MPQSQAQAQAAERLTVFAAASLKVPLEEIAVEFELYSGIPVDLSFAGSSLLARQLRFGADADVFLSANIAWSEWAADQGLLAEAPPLHWLTNRLVLVAAANETTEFSLDKPEQLIEAVQERPLAMGLVDAVPAGIYGRAALVSQGLWDDMVPYVAQTDNVQAALALVSRGAARLGIVYATDARNTDSIRVIATFPETSHPPIVYTAAATAAGDVKTANEFLLFLQSPASQNILRQYGFGIGAE
ncbi:molybdate ABC transporter substrate-binding protein [Phaeobacter sp.]|uniref:molybdate ABC transporter substrate-binding protein n=1 Tax=Phaeobacter sp. TaxID=1902409 RepID=UPI0025F4799E|nr:molybdate ABC transporter substrate-binding protein [Phaeobacter sp.]